MNTMVFLEDTLNQLQSFSTDEKQWLADKLYEQIREEKKKEKLVFPHISKGYKPNREVLDMVADRLPVEIDVEAEQAKMWEERRPHPYPWQVRLQRPCPPGDAPFRVFGTLRKIEPRDLSTVFL